MVKGTALLRGRGVTLVGEPQPCMGPVSPLPDEAGITVCLICRWDPRLGTQRY